MEIKKYRLLFIASFVWMIAGTMVLQIGVKAYLEITHKCVSLGIAIIVLFLFYKKIFLPLVIKNYRRIVTAETENMKIWQVFDTKGFFTMAIMMVGGVSLRMSHLLPYSFFASFYTGLGTALFLAGVTFMIAFLRERKKYAKSDILSFKS